VQYHVEPLSLVLAIREQDLVYRIIHDAAEPMTWRDIWQKVASHFQPRIPDVLDAHAVLGSDHRLLSLEDGRLALRQWAEGRLLAVQRQLTEIRTEISTLEECVSALEQDEGAASEAFARHDAEDQRLTRWLRWVTVLTPAVPPLLLLALFLRRKQHQTRIAAAAARDQIRTIRQESAAVRAKLPELRRMLPALEREYSSLEGRLRLTP